MKTTVIQKKQVRSIIDKGMAHICSVSGLDHIPPATKVVMEAACANDKIKLLQLRSAMNSPVFRDNRDTTIHKAGRLCLEIYIDLFLYRSPNLVENFIEALSALSDAINGVDDSYARKQEIRKKVTPLRVFTKQKVNKGVTYSFA